MNEHETGEWIIFCPPFFASSSEWTRRLAKNEGQKMEHNRRQWVVARRLVVWSLWMLLITASVSADEPRVVLWDADGRETSGSLLAISNASVRVGEQTIERKWSDVVRLRFEHAENVLHEPRGSAIWLANGDRLVARASGIENEQLHATWCGFPDWPAFLLPLEAVRGVSLSLPHARDRRDEVAAWVLDRSDPRDELRLANGDVSAGEVLEWNDASLTLKSAGRDLRLPLADVRDVAFNPELLTLPEPKELAWLVSLRDGSRLTLSVSKSRFVGTTLTGTHVCGATWEIPLDAIAELRVLRGRATFLSELTPIDARHTAFLPDAREWLPKRDRSVTGRPLRLSGREFPKGIGMHSRSAMTWELAGAFRSFHATVGLDDASVGSGTATCSVELDGRRAFEATLSRSRGPITLPLIDISAAKRLTLLVDFGDLGDSQDHVNWCDAVLLRGPLP